MAEPVIVPVQLEVTDIDTAPINFKDAEKEISNALSGIKKQIQGVFSGIDPSAINKPIEKSMGVVEKRLQSVTDAFLRYREVATKAGESTRAYRDATADLDARIANLKETLADYEQKGLAWLPQYKQVQAELEGAIAERSKIDPIQFVDDADPLLRDKVTNSLGKVISAYGKLNESATDFSQTAKDNRASDEYNELVAKAEKYKKQLADLNAKSKEMEFRGATDNQWENLRKDIDWTKKSMDDVIKQMDKAVKSGKAFRFGEGSKGDFRNQINSFKMSAQNNAKYGNARAQANESPYTKEYQDALNELDKLEKKMESIKAKSDKMIELGASKKQFQSLAYDADQLNTNVDEVKNRLTNMVNEGKAFKFGNGDADAEVGKISEKADGLQANLSEVSTDAKKAQGGLTALGATHPKLAAVLTVAGKIGGAFGKVMKVVAKVGPAIVKGFAAGLKVMGKVASGAGKVVGAFGRVAKGVFSAVKNLKIFGKSGSSTSTDMSKKFKKLSRNILMFGFGFRTAYYAVKRLRNIFIEGFKEMGKSFDEVGQPMATLIESFNRLKGSLATAFQPIVSVVMPILTRLMNYLTTMLEAIGKFNAALTGQGHIYKAVAKNIDSTTMAAEEANNQLGSYDKLEVINSDSGNNNTGYSYEMQKLDATDAASNFANMVKEAWASADFTSVGAFVTKKLLEVLGDIETDILPKITGFVNKVLMSVNTFLASFGSFDIGKKVGSLINTLVNGIDWEQVGALFANLNNTVWGFLDGLANGINWTTLGQSLATGITALFDTLDLDSWVGMISGFANGITTALYTMLTNVDWASVAAQLGTTVNNLFSSVDIGMIGTTIKTLFDTIWTMVGNFFATVDWGMIATNLSAGINNIFSGGSAFREAIPNVASGLVTFLTTAIHQIDWAAIGNTLLNSLQTVFRSLGKAFKSSDIPLFQAIGGVFDAVRQAIAALKPALNAILPAFIQIVTAVLPIITQLLPPIAKIINQVVMMLLPVLMSLIEALMPILMQIVAIILPILQQLMVALQPIFDVLVTTVLPVIVNLLAGLMPIVERILNVVMALLVPILQLIAPLIELVFNILDPIIAILMPILDIITLLVEVIGYVLTPILEILNPIISVISSVFGTFGSIVKMVIDVALQPIIDIIKFLVNLLMGVLKPAISAIQGIFNALCGALEFVQDAFTTVYNAIGEGAKKLWGVVKQPFNAILGGVESLANGVIRGINSMVKALNKLSFDVPDWVPVIGGGKFGFNLKTLNEVKIPRLAQGAVIPPNKEFLAMLGDQKHGTNIEAPLDTIKQALAEVLAEVGGGNREPIVLQVNGRTLAQVVWDEQTKRYKQTGRYSPA